MAPVTSPAPVPHNKRQKLNNVRYQIIGDNHQDEIRRLRDDRSSTTGQSTPVPASSIQASSFTDDSIKDYIPAGSIRLFREDLNIPTDAWTASSQWAVYSDPTLTGDLAINGENSSRSAEAVRHTILKSNLLAPYIPLFRNDLIRAEFKSNDDTHGQIRIYLLHARIDTRKAALAEHAKRVHRAHKLLFRALDLSNVVWNGKWTPDTPIQSLTDADDSEEDQTLLSLFNNLPSPNPALATLPYPCHCEDSVEALMTGNVYGLNTKMYEYQRRSAALMVQREVEPGLSIDPRLKVLEDHEGTPWYCDPDDCYYSRNPRFYDAPRGGILAENMGLGKTLICLGLILATRGQSAAIPPESSLNLIPVRKRVGSLLMISAAAINRHAVPWKDAFIYAADNGVSYTAAENAIKSQPGHYFLKPSTSSRASRNGKLRSQSRKILLSTTTLVVVPPNLLQQWINEINKHTTTLNILIMGDSKKALPTAMELLDYDIILFTKSRFDNEAKLGQLETSSLRDVHFKRLIYDEGHNFGSATSSSPTESFILMHALQITARWIISGTPSQGLYNTTKAASMQVQASGNIEAASDPLSNSITDPLTDKVAVEQERKDLIRLGNIAMHFLKVRPWSESPDGDVAMWQHYALQPRHGEKSRGNIECLRRTLEGMMIRHRTRDVDLEVRLPPLYENVVYLEPCLQNKMMLNTFALMIITNAVTSERTDVDYFFHPKQRKHLTALVNNLRQGSFFWSGFELEHLEKTINVAKTFLKDTPVPVSEQDVALLGNAIKYGETIVKNVIFENITVEHEIPMYLRNEWPSLLRRSLSLDDLSENPTLFSAPMLFDMQKYVFNTENPAPRDLVIAAHQTCLREEKVEKVQKAQKSSGNGITNTNIASKKAAAAALEPLLSGAALIGREHKPKTLLRLKSKNLHLSLMDQDNLKLLQDFELDLMAENQNSVNGLERSEDATHANMSTGNGSSSSTETNVKHESQHILATKLRGFLDTTQLISTASTKLSYLLSRIIQHYADEKIIVFYEDSNTAYYIAQYLECLNIKHLIYATELKTDLRSRFVASFNTTDTFRVLLMDVSQAAFGLDISSASRIYFISPVFSPQIEAQAVKRAHRIGQIKPVHVETLVLRGSIEEAVVARRGAVSKEEHQKIKSLLDDETLYHWIRNIQLIPMELEQVPGPEQMATLNEPQAMFANDWRYDHGVSGAAGIVDVQPSVSGTSTPFLISRQGGSSGRSTPVLIAARLRRGSSAS